MTTTTLQRLTLAPPALSSALSAVTRAISTRTTLPILNNVLIQAGTEGLTLTATNLEIGIRKIVPAEVVGEWATTVPARLLTDFVATLPDKPLTLTLEDSTLSLRCGTFDTHIRCIEADEFPPGPQPDGGAHLTIPLDLLLHAIEQTEAAASTDEARPVLTGILVDIADSRLTMVATDGHRLAERRLSLGADNMIGVDEDVARAGAKLIVPARALAELTRAFKGEADLVDVLIAPARNQVFFRCGSAEVTSRLIDGQYPNYGQVIPVGTPTTAVRLSTVNLSMALRTVGLFGKDSANAVRLLCDSGSDDADSAPRDLRLTATTNEIGDASASVEAFVQGAEIDIALNARYLLDALAAMGAEVEMQFRGALSPVLLVDPADKNIRIVVMPLRVGGGR